MSSFHVIVVIMNYLEEEVEEEGRQGPGLLLHTPALGVGSSSP